MDGGERGGNLPPPYMAGEIRVAAGEGDSARRFVGGAEERGRRRRGRGEETTANSMKKMISEAGSVRREDKGCSPASDDAVEEGGRRAPPLLAGWGSAQAAGEETKFEAEAETETGWDGLGCSPVSECGGSRRTPAPPLLAGWRSAPAAGEETGVEGGGRGDGTDWGGGGRAALCCRGPHVDPTSQPAILFHLTPLYSHLNPNLQGIRRWVGRRVSVNREKLDGGGRQLTWLPMTRSAHVMDLRTCGVWHESQLQLQCRLHRHA
uniref:Uncharacterized protein n=1 Tax=Oryza nivara TaxID=4536 RepID=A0A0E0I735_ORYNI